MKWHLGITVFMILLAVLPAACNSVKNPQDAGKDLPSLAQSPTGLTDNQSTTGIITSTPDVHLGTIRSVDNVPDILRMPLYPGARNLQIEFSNTFPPISKTSFDTNDDFDKVIAYYVQLLTQQGWVCAEDPGQLPCNVYVWTSDDPDVLSNFAVWISDEVLADGTTNVGLVTRRWPDATKIPLGPDAHQIEVKSTKDLELEGVWQRVTTYLTMASPSDVETNFRSILTLPDWQEVEDSGSVTSEQGMSFRYMRDVNRENHVDEYRGGVVNIKAQPEGGGGSRVEIIVTGTDIKPPNK